MLILDESALDGKLGGMAWLLTTEDPALSPEARYLLVRVWLMFGTSPVRLKIKQLQELFGISRKTFLDARGELLADPRSEERRPCLVTRYQDDWPDWGPGKFTRGRPVREFRVERALGQKLASMPIDRGAVSQANKVAAALHCRAVQLGQNTDSFDGRVQVKAEDQLPSRLAIPGKLLLAILWNLADRRGVVIDAGLRRLSRLVGMSPSRVRNHLHRLEQLGFFTLRVPGLTGRFVPGKVPSALVLNSAAIGYPKLATDTPSTGIFLNLGELSPVASVHRKCDRISNKRSAAAVSGKVNDGDSDRWIEAEASAYPGLVPPHQEEEEGDEKPPPLYSAFAGEPRRAEVREYLLFKACDYVTWLVNEYPTELHDGERGERSEPDAAGALLERVERELLSNGQLRERYKGARVLLARWFCIHVWRRAREVIAVMAKNEEASPESVTENIGSRYSDILLMPVRGKTVHFLTYDCREQTDQADAKNPA